MAAPMNDPSPLMTTSGSATFTTAVSGAALDLREMYSTFTFSKVVTGVFSALVTNFEGSLDGTNWYQVGTDNTLVNGATFVVDKPCRFLRLTVGTFTGGTNVAVLVGCVK